MASLKNILYSIKLAENSSYVFIDGVCIKSRGDRSIGIESALETGRTVLIQEKNKVKVYSENERYSFFEKLINYEPTLRDAAYKGLILLDKNQHKK